MSDWRHATPDDAAALRDVERAANLVALAHVFPPGDFPFPDAEVLTRWRDVLATPEVTVEVVDGPAGLVAFTSYDASSVRHLAVHPDAWGRGLGRAAVSRATLALAARGVGRPTLWVLRENHRARGLYGHLGWRPTGRTQPCPWPPYPLELELVLEV